MIVRADAAVSVRCQFTAGAAERDIAVALAMLSEDERLRAARFRFERDRRDYAMAHALLRTMLSERDGRRPTEWRFRADAHGKPHLVEDPALAFSLSHTDGLVACAVAEPGTIGVDVERVDRANDWRAIARRYFAAAEVRTLDALDDTRGRAAFIEIWTLKEAFAKAVGLGLSQALDATTFRVTSEGEVHFDLPDGADAGDWRFSLHAPAPEYRLAVALTGAAIPPWTVQMTTHG